MIADPKAPKSPCRLRVRGVATAAWERTRRIADVIWQWLTNPFWHWMKGFVYWGGVLVALLLTVALLGLTSVQLQISAGRPAGGVWRRVADAVLWVLCISENDRVQRYPTLVTAVSQVILVLVSVWLVILPLVDHVRRQKRERARREREQTAQKAAQSLTMFPVATEGSDDVEIMMKWFADAERVVVHAGDFDWLGTQSKVSALRDLLTKLAHERKLLLFSHKTEEAVKRAMGEHHDAFKDVFAYNDKRKIKCSMASYGAHGPFVFLYRTKIASATGVANHVCVLRTGNDSRPLLEALSTLCGNGKS